MVIVCASKALSEVGVAIHTLKETLQLHRPVNIFAFT